MSHLRFVADPFVYSLQQVPEGGRSLLLRAATRQSRAFERQALPMTLAVCGCGAPVLTETEERLAFCFDLPLEAATCVYWALVEAELAFDEESHRELTRLCTVQSHAAEYLIFERPCTVRLEVRFRAERLCLPVLPAAARA